MPEPQRDMVSIQHLDYNLIGHPVVLLLHGLGADSTSWGYQFPALVQAGMRIIAPDIPGFGQSQRPQGRWSITNASKSIVKFLDEKGIGQAVVVGISMGGTIALQIGLDYPTRVKKLVLVNTFASLRPKRLNEIFYMLTRFARANLLGIPYQAEMVARRLFPNAEQENLRQELIARIVQSDPKVYREAMISLGMFNARSRLSQIKLPTLVMSGANDTTVSQPNQQSLARGISGARHCVIESAGHALIVDQPDVFNETLIAFINEEL